jgi:hypothetical protein
MPRIIEEIKGLDPSRSELVELASCFMGLEFIAMLNSFNVRRALDAAI